MVRFRPGISLLAILPLVGGCVSTTDIEAIQAQLSDIQRQVMVLQQQSSSKEEVALVRDEVATQTDKLLGSEAEMLVGVEQLSTQIEQLQANLGDTNYRLAQLSQQITATNQELQAVRSALGGSLRRPSTPSIQPPENPRELYDSSYSDYLAGNYSLAISGFRRYLDSFPETDLADNANYWVAESLFSQRKYSQAIGEFDRILKGYPSSDKTASVLLKKGYAYLEVGQREQGLLQLRNVVGQFPQSDEANLARQRLRSLGVDPG